MTALKKRALLFLPLLALLAAQTARAEDIMLASMETDRTIYLASLDWPPYSMSSGSHGASEDVARAAFAAMGYALVTDYFPWLRAVTMGQGNPKYLGYYPAYPSTERAARCYVSNAIGESPLGLAQPKDSNLSGKSLDQMTGSVIGIVSGYVNGKDVDQRLQDGRLIAEAATDDLTNLRKVINGRIPAAVIDVNAMNYLLANNRDQFPRADQLTFESHGMDVLTLHVCFRRDAEGNKAAAIFNEGLRRIDAKAMSAAYFTTLMKN